MLASRVAEAGSLVNICTYGNGDSMSGFKKNEPHTLFSILHINLCLFTSLLGVGSGFVNEVLR